MRGGTLIVLPTYCEARNIGRLLRDLARLQPDADLLVVDDGSPDGTGAVAEEAARELPRVTVLQRGGKLGLGTAHVAGMDRALAGPYDVLVTMDCDYTHRPEDVSRLVAALRERGADLVIGSRYEDASSIRDWPLWRRGVTRTAHFLTQHLLGMPFDATNAFRAYRTTALARVPYKSIRGDGYSFMFEMVYACVGAGLVIEQVSVELPLRQAGESKISRVEIARAIVALGRLTSARAVGLARRAFARDERPRG